jgi:hypothetical protein
MRCYDDGALRAYLDDALPEAQQAELATHTRGCAACSERLERQASLAAHASALLALPPDSPDPQRALARLRASQAPTIETTYGKPATAARRNTMQSRAPFWAAPRRGLFAGMAAIMAIVALLTLPPVRVAANQLLQIFRVQKVMFMPISPERIEQLKQLDFDGSTLFVGKPKIVNQPAEPRTVDSAAAAADAAGFSIAQPSLFPSPPTSTSYVVHDRMVMQSQVNVEAARQLLALLDIKDVTLPDSLGAQPISADVPPFVETRYTGDGYNLTLRQGHSPTLTLPDGVDVAQLGKAGLRLLGMDEAAAEELSSRIDWSSTLIFPFPQDIHDIREVQVGGARGLLVSEGRRSGQHWQLYWQNGERFSMLEVQGNLGDADVIALAESVQ